MKRKSLWWAGVCAVALLLPLASRAADEPAKVAGKWELSMEGRQGPVTQDLKIEQDGGKIKGTLQGPRGETKFEGTVEGNKIHFSISRDTPRGEMTIEYSGTVEGDTMKGTMGGGRFSRDWTAKRVKEKD